MGRTLSDKWQDEARGGRYLQRERSNDEWLEAGNYIGLVEPWHQDGVRRVPTQSGSTTAAFLSGDRTPGTRTWR